MEKLRSEPLLNHLRLFSTLARPICGYHRKNAAGLIRHVVSLVGFLNKPSAHYSRTRRQFKRANKFLVQIASTLQYEIRNFATKIIFSITYFF